MDEKSHGDSTPDDKASAAPTLEVVRGENAGETFDVKASTSIGRERDNDVILLDLKASRHHAQIYLKDDQWLLEDLGSANGTFLNDTQVTAPRTLRSGDRIAVGETELVFAIPGQPGPEPVPAAAAEQPQAESASPAPVPAPAPAPAPSAAAAQTPAGQRTPPRLAWIAGGFILLICFAAVVSIYIIISRIGESDSTAENVDPPAAQEGSSGDSATSPTAAQPVQAPLGVGPGLRR